MTATPPLRGIQRAASNIEVSGVRVTTADTDGDPAAAGRGGIHVMTSGSRAWIHHNILDNVAQSGITVEGTNTDVHDNLILNSREHGIYVSNGSENIVHDNILLDARQDRGLPAVQGI